MIIFGWNKKLNISDELQNIQKLLLTFRWRVDSWAPCSATCGGGSQTRIVRCMKGPDGRSREVESQHCLGTGRRPSDTRLCNLLPCARWATTHWGAVSLLNTKQTWKWSCTLPRLFIWSKHATLPHSVKYLLWLVKVRGSVPFFWC